jgi:DNA polymerase I-like protein with 3'-5' exonuclease and polymerase domains
VQIVTLDFETFYAKTYGLRKYTTEEYILNPQFQVIGVAIQIDDGKPVWYAGGQASKAIALVDWRNSMLICHNTQFDGAILKWVYGHEPVAYLDTLCMARAKHGVEAGGSLKALAERYQIGEKGTEVLQALGMRLEDFPEHQLRQYGEYCKNDVRLTYDLFKILSKGFPLPELKLIDITLRMFILPILRVNDKLLEERLKELKEEKTSMLKGLMETLNCDTEEAVRKKLASNIQFAKILEDMHIPVPMKVSPTTEKETYALAKTDAGFIELQESDNPILQELCAVRLGTKSTIEESRIQRFIDIGLRNQGRLPIPLKYYGAHTGRWSGMDKVNFQNLPSRDVKKKALKNAILPPVDHVILNVDSSQIEARILVWLAGQHDQVELYRQGKDVYCDFASRVYKKTINKRNKKERAVGKTCILGLGYGTGHVKLKGVLKLNAGIEVNEIESKRLIKLYREVNHEVVKLWDECDRALRDIASWPADRLPYYLGSGKCLLVEPKGIKLPNGLYITYPDLQLGSDGYEYKSRRGTISIWGGAVVENVVQALARIVIGEQMIEINEKHRPVLTVHDAVVCVSTKATAQDTLDYVMGIMNTAPIWAEDLPIACEGAFGDTYGDC